MKDAKYIILFSFVGLVLAYAVSGPLRKPAGEEPKVGTPLRSAPVYVDGTISVDPSVQANVSTSKSLFIIVRSPAGGPPIAVQKHDFPKFPFKFSLSSNDNMVGDDFYDGDIKVTARLDVDGFAGPKEDGDRESMTEIKKGQPRTIQLAIK